MNLSYWEYKSWFSNIDYTVVGSGIVGIHCALALRNRFPKSKILILEKGILPQGASTKNAGFACFGSISEIISDLKSHSEETVLELILKRWKGLQVLRNNLGDTALDYQNLGGYELFLNDDETYSDCLQLLPSINELFFPLFKTDVFKKIPKQFFFQGVKDNLIYNPLEGQIDTGKMMMALLQKAVANNILILNNTKVNSFYEKGSSVEVSLNDFCFLTKKLLFATNGFAGAITNNQVKPARAQVLITDQIPNLKIKGTFHLDRGYYYFRNIDNRIMLGGGRNLAIGDETTTEFGQTELIQNRLELLLKEVILPNTNYKIAQRWSGIMGVGTSKTPIVTQISDHVYCGVRLGGMGVAIGSLIGQDLADLIK